MIQFVFQDTDREKKFEEADVDAQDFGGNEGKSKEIFYLVWSNQSSLHIPY